MFGFGINSISEKLFAALSLILFTITLALSLKLWIEKMRVNSLENEKKAVESQLDMQNSAILGMKSRNDALMKLAQNQSEGAAKLRAELSRNSIKIQQVKLTGNECDDLKSIVDSARSVTGN